MSATDLATELSARTATIGEERSLCGWGRTARSRSRVLRPRDADDVVEALVSQTQSSTGLIARGAGRSYGDAAQNDGGCVLDMTGLDRILSIDGERRLITAQAGVTVAQIMAGLAPHGLTLPVVPGTRHVTLGGAIASDIHGKNHHRDGGLARHVVALSLCTPAGECLELSPGSDPELFYATLGGMGLTGIVVQATLAVEPLASPWVAADIDRTDGLEQTLELMSGEERHRYSVAWLDLLADGSKMGRAVVSRADSLPADSLPADSLPADSLPADPLPAVDPLPVDSPPRLPERKRRTRRAYPGALLRAPMVSVPNAPWSLLHPTSVRAFNVLRWRSSPRRERGRPLALVPYFFPLDGVGAWNRLYGAAGLVQYQFVVPDGQEMALMRCFELLRVRRLPVYLAVFKRFGASFGGPLSFPLAGWTLAVDLPAATPGLGPALDELDEVVAGCGGRVYLTKDVRLRRETLVTMYPELDRFRAQRARVDPEGVLRSDLARRLGLCEVAR